MRYKNIVFSIAPIASVAILGSVFFKIGQDWYMKLNRPSMWPPDLVFPILWTTIYTLFAIYLYTTLKEDKLTRKEMTYLIINGALNILWCLLFFTFKMTFLGLIVIILNAVMSILLVLEIEKKNRKFGMILSIYPIWMLIATALNLATWILN